MDKTTFLCYIGVNIKRELNCFMNGICLGFDAIPHIGFAHHFRMENYMQDMANIKKPDLYDNKGIEIVYIKEGSIIAEVYGKKYTAEPGSIMVLLRALPFKLYAKDSAVRTHCSLELRADYRHSIIQNGNDVDKNTSDLLLPFINPPCAENEKIKKILFSIVSDIGARGGRTIEADSGAALYILSMLDSLYRSNLYESSSSVTEYKIKAYIADRIHRTIPVAEIAQYMGKTPNYLNSVFKKSSGMGIHQYINKEKVRIISQMILDRKLPFGKACESVGIDDVSYGYRMFKKHTGLTPSQFTDSQKYSG